jgi:hypothetical protein
MDSTKRESIQKLILLIDENYQIGSNTDTDVKNDVLKYLLEQLKEYKPKEEPKPEPVVQKIYIQSNEPRCNNNEGEVNYGKLLFEQYERGYEMKARNRIRDYSWESITKDQ